MIIIGRNDDKLKESCRGLKMLGDVDVVCYKCDFGVEDDVNDGM